MADHPGKVKQRMVRRKKRVHKKISGTAERPRLVVVRSLNHISASLINDVEGRTLMGFIDSTLKDDAFQVPEKVAEKANMGRKVALAYRVGLAIADKAKEHGVESVVFDRNGLRYHGRVRALADGARKGGLKF